MSFCLALDTSGGACTVALVSADGTLSVQISRQINRGHAEVMLGQITALFTVASEQAGREIGYEHLSRVAVVTGPGSFTGLRVGLSTARGIALARDIPCIGISGLDLAALMAFQTSEQASQSKQVCAVLAGRGGQIFYRRFTLTDGAQPPYDFSHLQAVGAAGNDDPSVLLGAEPLIVAGDGEAIVQAASSTVICAGVEILSAEILAAAAFSLDPANYPPEPSYLRGADAVKAKAVFPLSPSDLG